MRPLGLTAGKNQFYRTAYYDCVRLKLYIGRRNPILSLMKKYPSGFGLVGIIILVFLAGAVSAAGWMVYTRQAEDKKDAAQSSSVPIQTVAATDSTKTFSYAYPGNWTLQKYVWTPCCEGELKTEPDWTVQTQPITLKEKSSPLGAAIRIDGFGPDAIEREYGARTIDRFNTYTKLKISGYQALYHVKDFVGPSNAEKYKDHEYIISDPEGERSVRLQFRERYSNSTLRGENDFDASRHVPDFQNIVRSVRFLPAQPVGR